MTRAAYACLDGRIVDAFRFNPFGMVFLPLAFVALSIEVFFWVRGETPTWRLPIGKRGAVVIALTLIAFGLLRNLPWWPFSLLAPH
jgi:hypothetical protein